jgi:hypothetical protein
VGSQGKPGPTGPTGPTGSAPNGLAGYAWFFTTSTQIVAAGAAIDFATATNGPQAGSIVTLNLSNTTQFVFDKSGTYAVTYSIVPHEASDEFGLHLNGSAVPGAVVSGSTSGQPIESRVLITVNAEDVLTIANTSARTEEIVQAVPGQPSASIVFEQIGVSETGPTGPTGPIGPTG